MVSIIIPTFNRAELIGATLDSVLAQTYESWECIIVDDGSTDYTEELLSLYCSKDSRINYIKRPAGMKKGANSCRNYGFQLSKGEYIQWFDSDDVMLPGFLEKKIKLFTSGIEMVICKGFYTNEDLKIESQTLLESHQDLFKSFVLWNSHLLTPSILFRRTFLEKRKKFDPEIHKGQEAEFFSRLFFRLPDELYVILDEPLFYYRLHKDSSTIKNKKYIEDYKRSESSIAVQNLKRSIEIRDYELINHLYIKLLFLYFEALDHQDHKNSWFILKNLLVYLGKVDVKLSLLLGGLIVFPGLTGRRSYNLERKLRLYKIH